MFLLNDLPILADEMDILLELKNQLAINGVYRFATLKQVNDHIQFNCPMHKEGQERKPSCSITTSTIKYANGRIIKPGIVHCFTCGYVATLNEMISALFGKDDGGRFGNEWLAKNFVTLEVEKREPIQLNLDRKKQKSTIITPKYITEEELDSYRYTHPYMYKRKLTDQIIELFDIGYDNQFRLDNKNGGFVNYRCITFPIKDEKGNVLFIARRSVDTKFFHYPEGVIKPVYGIYELKQYYGNNLPKEIIICESMFNALTCWVYGTPAVALNGTGTPEQLKQLDKLPIRKFILGLDPDNAGNNGRKKIHKYFKNKKMITDLVIPEGKDINDLTKDEFDNLKETFTYF